MGSLRRSGAKGIFAMRYYDRTGRQREESTHTTDRDEAERLLKNREAAIANGAAVTPQIGRFTFEDGVALIVQDYQLQARDSLPGLERRIRIGLAPWFGRRRLASVSTADVSTYAAARKTAGASNATINRELAALKRIFRLAVRGGFLLQRPEIPLLKEARPRKGFFEPEAWTSVLAHLRPDHRPWALLAYYSGWRVRSDLWPLEWSAIDRDQQLIRIAAPDTKNETGRVFAYGPFKDLVAAIDACWQVHQAGVRARRIEPRVFVRMGGRKRGQPIKSARKAWRTACRQAGHPGRTPHDFRRTAARNLERHGVPRTVAKALIGHKTDEMYERYAIVAEGDMQAAATRLASGLKAEAVTAKRRAARDAKRVRQGELQGEVGKNGLAVKTSHSDKLRLVKEL